MGWFGRKKEHHRSAKRIIGFAGTAAKVEISVVVSQQPYGLGWGRMTDEQVQASLVSTADWAIAKIRERALQEGMQLKPEEIYEGEIS